MSTKKAIITGGTRGIGYEAVQLLIKNNIEVTAIVRDKEKAKNILPNCALIEYDLSDLKNIKTLLNQLPEADILINNAGIMNTCSIDDYPTSKREALMNINLYTVVELIDHVKHSMIKNGGGRIVNNASIAGHIGHPDVWYGISKAAIINLTKSYAKLYGKNNIVINTVAPGPVNTDLMNNIPVPRQQSLKNGSYAGRFAEPSEIAETMLWLATNSPSYINGICLDINNGAFPR